MRCAPIRLGAPFCFAFSMQLLIDLRFNTVCCLLGKLCCNWEKLEMFGFYGVDEQDGPWTGLDSGIVDSVDCRSSGE